MTATTDAEGGVHDFDFLFGRWTVTNRRLTQRLADSDEWEEFSGAFHCEPRLGGIANVDEMAVLAKGFSGMALRLFDVGQREWSIYWIDSRDGRLQPPVTGRFRNGRGEFQGNDVDEGRPVRVRFVWSDITGDSARWEQAFSTDGGRTWETNWIMEFTRVE
ncbi:MAG TPA: hypothetical protein VFO41_10075 [Alphaproteobacteria bacterium]|nr:hypothetical protein [Alphaproteobacteria bacterium]